MIILKSKTDYTKTNTWIFYAQSTAKVSPFRIALIKKWQDAGTTDSAIDRFDLVFQYQIKNIIKKKNGLMSSVINMHLSYYIYKFYNIL